MNRILFASLLLLSLACDGANVVQKTIQQSGGDYTSLSGWEAGRQTNCVTADSIEMGVIQGSWSAADTTAVTINGWTTDATRYIVVTNSTSKHDGKRYGSAANAYKFEIANAYAVTISEEYVNLYGLQINITGITADRVGILASASAASLIKIGNCIITGTSVTGGAGLIGVQCNGASTTAICFNTLCYKGAASDNLDGRPFFATGGTFTLYNCTAAGSYYGFWEAAGTMDTYGCISQDCIVSGNTWVGTMGGDWNCDDTNDVNTPGANSVKNYEVTFVSETGGSEDYHITSANTSIIDVTSDQSGGLFSDDIDGVTRAGSWCIGADEYVAAANSIFQVITSQ